MTELMGKRTGETFDCLLAGGVGGGERKGRERGAGCDVDDRAGPALSHLGNDRLRHCHHTKAVGVEDRADCRHWRCFESADHADAGIVHQHIDRTCRIDQGRDALPVRHIQRQDAQPVIIAAEAIGIRTPHGRNDIPATREEKFGGRFAIAG
ncbi:hypothetical protein D3C78_1155900 [compost metagenome]